MGKFRCSTLQVGLSENTAVVLDVVQQVELESSKIGALLFTTIQTDLGSANTSEIVENHFKKMGRITKR